MARVRPTPFAPTLGTLKGTHLVSLFSRNGTKS
jgi:hypothetical protein